MKTKEIKNEIYRKKYLSSIHLYIVLVIKFILWDYTFVKELIKISMEILKERTVTIKMI